MMDEDNLWYLRQLELQDTQLKERLIERVQAVQDGDHMQIFKDFFRERKESGLEGDDI